MVDGWRVDPAGVESVLNSVANRTTTMSTALGGSEDGSVQGVDTIVQDAATAAESQVIGEAVAGFFEHRKATLTGIQNRIRASLLGASGATKAIIAGDEHMAATTQANAVSAASTGDFAAFDGAPGAN
ncbi:hypothetical protein GCM10017714_03220 [Curtobacterium pusillum]|uniref:PE domain-containing protein n=1 Tax=Curtobacterium pusillum TaxID=69373 RepID=A0AAW3T9C2_9MICO|nr:DUF6507 family protein [Curtobacterium pusillum]MBA8991746.1 hypothetical protein [Curtobacterium pusillum]NUU13908.1 hypothetical protein [Curtobacterium pusillum]GLK31184.1 hypothetical protein GCM10017610_14690 [Curtobacterium pusillum]